MTDRWVVGNKAGLEAKPMAGAAETTARRRVSRVQTGFAAAIAFITPGLRATSAQS